MESQAAGTTPAYRRLRLDRISTQGGEMNRNPDRTPVTVSQLENMARTLVTDEDMANMRGVHEKAPMWRSWLEGVTRQLRFDMCMRGQLILDTSEPFTPASHPPITIDPFFLNP
jgi:hypothetical protein